MRCDIKGNRDKIVHDISRYRMKLGTEISTYILFLHAFTGCDSTSRIFSFRKQAAFTRFLNSSLLQEVAKVFSSESKHHSEIERSGHNAMIALFRETPQDSLNSDIAFYFKGSRQQSHSSYLSVYLLQNQRQDFTVTDLIIKLWFGKDLIKACMQLGKDSRRQQ